jgi:hypothetical protein
MFFENLVGLRIFFRERIADDPVVFQKTMDIHRASFTAGVFLTSRCF